MKRIPIDGVEPELDRLREAGQVLRAGGVLACPTDTLYGLAVDPRNERAVQELYRMKGRPVDRRIPLIAADREQVESLAGPLDAPASALAHAFWPGPLSIVIPAWPGLAPSLLGGELTVAVRVPDHKVARGLAAALGHPVTATSANLSGAPPTADPEEVARAFGSDVAALIDGGRAPGGPPSTIVDTTSGRLRLVRAGAVPWERVLASVPADLHPVASGS